MLKSKHDLITVIIPTKNRLELLTRAVGSVMEQSYCFVEIIIIDDGSDMPFTVDDLGFSQEHGKTIKIIRNAESVGAAKSRNIGLRLSSGDFISFLDDDDIIYPNKLELLHAYLNNNYNVDAVFGRTLLNNGFEKKHPIKYPNYFNSDHNIRLMNSIHTASSLIKKEALLDIKFNERLARFQDLQFYMELACKKKVEFYPIDVCEWNVDGREDQITSNSTLQKRKKAYLAFHELVDYLKYRHVLEGRYLPQYYFYLSILAIKSGNYLEAITWARHLLLPFNFYFLLVDVFYKKRFFN